MASNTEIRVDINDVINKLNKVLLEEKLSVYERIIIGYKNALEILDKNSDNELIKKEVSTSLRLFMEAPPKNKDLSLSILLLMDKISKKLNP